MIQLLPPATGEGGDGGDARYEGTHKTGTSHFQEGRFYRPMRIAYYFAAFKIGAYRGVGTYLRLTMNAPTVIICGFVAAAMLGR